MSNTKFLDPEQVLFRTGLTRNSQVLDLGAGSGFFALAAAKMVGESGFVTVVDILEQSLEHVQAMARMQNLRNLRTLRKDLEVAKLAEFPVGSFDFVVVSNVLHQIKNRKNLFELAYQALKTGGRMLIIDWNDVPSPIGPSVADRVPAAEVKTLAQQANLHFNNKLETDQYHYGLIFNK